MCFVSHTVTELKTIPCPEIFKEILPFYFIKYTGREEEFSDGTVQLSLMDDSDIVIEDNKCVLTIGRNTFIGPSHLAVTEDGSQLTIGEECMISSNVQVRTGDSHAIFDASGRRINHAASVHIGNMVWLGEGCKVLKGVTLKNNTIVSTGAIVTKSFEGNVLIGGIPATVLKENVSWSHSRK